MRHLRLGQLRPKRLPPKAKWKAVIFTTAATTTGVDRSGAWEAGAEAVGFAVGIVAPSGLYETLTQGRYSFVVIVVARTARTSR